MRCFTKFNQALMFCLGAFFLTAAGFLVAEEIRYVADGDERYADFKQLARHYRLKIKGHWHGQVQMTRKDLVMEFEKGSRRAMVDGYLVWLNVPSYQVGGRWGLSEIDVKNILEPYARPDDILKKVGHKIVVIDAGHGGGDSGGLGVNATQEKDVVLELAKLTRKHLVNAGLTVYMTRDIDKALTLKERCRFAQSKKADVFVSIHVNAAGNTSAAGVETYILPPPGYSSTSDRYEHKPEVRVHRGNAYDGANLLLGFYLHKELVQSYGAEDRGVRQARFVVLRDAPCPAVLVECGFITNPTEETQMNTDYYMKNVSRGLALGVLNYIQQVKQSHLTMAPPSKAPAPVLQIKPSLQK